MNRSTLIHQPRLPAQQPAEAPWSGGVGSRKAGMGRVGHRLFKASEPRVSGEVQV